MSATAKLAIEHVTKHFAGPGSGRRGANSSGGVTALNDLNLEIPDGEFLVIVGPSGCGKSTLLDLLAGLSAPTDGQIKLDGVPITGPGSDRGIVFQQYALLPWRSAQKNVEFGLETTKMSKRERTERAREFLDLVGLTGFEESYPHQLSGGMKQRVAIARSLANDPTLLIMDEPFGALDALTRDGLQTQLARIWEQTGKTVVFVTHSIDEAVYLGQRVAVMSARPGHFKRVLDIPLKTDIAVAEARLDPQFAHLSQQLWEELRDEIESAAAVTAPVKSPHRHQREETPVLQGAVKEIA
jgi:NitT/TauT family transport system ATP-binding protein